MTSPETPAVTSPDTPAPSPDSAGDIAPARLGDGARRPIPRPQTFRPGSPAPWAHLGLDERYPLPLERVLTAVRASQPRAGEVRHRGPWRTLAGEVMEASPAAVLVALFEEGGDTRVILTVRSDRLRSHQGEVAFPGGRFDVGENAVAAALREAYEEVSLDPGLVDVVGELTPMPTRSSDTVMTPVVGSLTGRTPLQANPAEVDRVFDVALSDLAADGAFHEEWWSVRDRPGPPPPSGGEFPVWFFEVAGETVWGATARTLVELLCLVLGVKRPESAPVP
ncbi:MAG TPA: CoA pyrophosphatase [Acidimicrobiales bacterium]|nr:CoA pyrophosphatase [Acidimicrobiales bacterium]